MASTTVNQEQSLQRAKAKMGERYVFHPNYNTNKPSHHTTRDRGSHHLRLVMQNAIQEGRL